MAYRVRTSIVSLTIVSMAGCATNPQTGKMGFSPSVQHGIDSVKSGIANIYDNSDPCSNNDRNIGITLGIIGGAILGHELKNNTTGTLLGAAVGAGVGGVIGHSMDTRRCALYHIAQQNHISLASAVITNNKLNGASSAPGSQDKSAQAGLDVMVKNDGEEFVPGTSRLTPKAEKAYGEIADLYRPAAMAANTTSAVDKAAAYNRKILIVGHADDSGSHVDAAKLSEARAKAVAKVFARHGVPSENLYYQGAGDSLPISSNATENGRADNRRVQIVDLPSSDDLSKYLSKRSANPADFNHQAASGNTVATSNAPATHAKHLHGGEYDFGGSPATGEMINLGVAENHSMFSFIRSANAAPVMMGSCLGDTPHDAMAVRNFATGDEFPVRDAIPGLYGAPITGIMNGNMIAVLSPYAPRDAGSPVPMPTLQVYRDYTKHHSRHASFSERVPVNVYRGSQATLYRMFVKAPGAPIECMDIVLPSQRIVPAAKVHYVHAGKQFVAQDTFSVKR